MEKCDYTPDRKHFFNNSWGSLIHGFCGLCICTRSVTPKELREALIKNECNAEQSLIENLHRNVRISRRFA